MILKHTRVNIATGKTNSPNTLTRSSTIGVAQADQQSSLRDRSTIRIAIQQLQFSFLVFHPLTLTTFLLPFCAPPGRLGVPGAAPGNPSCAFIPALTASIKTPVDSAGEYGDTLVAKGNSGSGGMGRRRRRLGSESFCGCSGTLGDLDLDNSGCLPFLDDGAVEVRLAGVDAAAGE